MKTKVLTVEKLNISVKQKQIIEDFSFTLSSGETIGIIGKSAVGKSTLLFAISGLLDKSYTLSGSVKFAEQINILELTPEARQAAVAKNLSVVFQDTVNALDPYESIGKQLKELIVFKEKLQGKAAENRMFELLDLVGLENEKTIVNKYPHQISGGMAQKICLALAFAGKPKIILADEPTASMDAIYQLEFVRTISRLAKAEAISMIFVSHDLALVSNFCERILVMEKKHLVEDKATTELINNPQSKMAKTLLSASRKMLLYENNRNKSNH